MCVFGIFVFAPVQRNSACFTTERRSRNTLIIIIIRRERREGGGGGRQTDRQTDRQKQRDRNKQKQTKRQNRSRERIMRTSKPSLNKLATGYIQTPGWVYLTEEKPIEPPRMDSWVNVSILSAHNALVTMLDVNLVDPSRSGCVEQSLKLWGTLSLPPDSRRNVELSHIYVDRYCYSWTQYLKCCL